MSAFLKWAVTIIAGYLLGSISSGLLVAKAAGGPNLREVGSGNTGTTNVIRTMGKKAGYITFLFDFLKAILGCLVGQLLLGHEGAMVGGFFAVIGHNWPVFFGFKGGKGVCSSMAIALFCFPLPTLICYVVGFAVMFATKYVSAGSLSGVLFFCIEVIVLYHSSALTIVWALLLAALMTWRHKANIQRILNGTENKIGQKKKK